MIRRNAAFIARQQGFTITEMLVAMAIMLAVTVATFNLMDPAQGMFAAQPEVSDMQQRLRIGVETLCKDLLMVGGGTYSGSAAGSLGNYFAPILPYRTGNVTPDPPASWKTNRLTLVYVPPTTAQTTIADPMPSVSADIKVTAEAGCPSGDQLCGFEEGMTVLIFDASGAFDTFNITSVQSGALHLQHRGEDVNKPYGTGSYISQIVQYTYWLKTDTVAETYQLMRYDGNQTDLPIVENVVGLTFEYYGEPQPPVLRPRQTPPTTYGPNPPALGVNNTADIWGAGENCTFMVSGGQQVTRLATLGPANGPLIKLTEDMVKDGPWCPDASAAGRYDADLLRIRKIRVTLRVQAGNKAFRAAAGTLFTYGGSSTGGERYIPDQEITFDVTPRNLNLGR
jgi:prepilin-type N-terminal cleavage/methylation domain-containing protein